MGRIEGDELSVRQRGDELDDEEGIAAGLLVNEERERLNTLEVADERVGEQPPDVMDVERCHEHLVHPRAGRLDALERLRKRVGLSDLAVAVGADDEKMPDLHVRDDVLEQVEGRRVEPLQVVEEQHERMLLRGDDAEDPSEHHLESVPRLLRRELRYGRLLADDELDFRNEVRNQLPVRAERASDGIAPPTELGVALAQDRTDDAPQGLREGRIRNVTLVLIELSAREQSARNHQRLLKLVDHRGLADARRSGHEHELRRALRHDPLESLEQGLDLAFPAVESLRNEKPVSYVLRCEGKGGDAAG